MNNKYKEYAYNYLLKKLKKINISFRKGVSVITCTNKPNTLINILNNFNRQDFEEKELIIIINNDDINIDSWIEETKVYSNVKVYKVSEKTSLGKCLNMAIDKSIFDTIAKFDDDDYYGPKYLSDTLKAFEKTKAKVIGKGSTFVYFVEKELLAIRSPNSENKYVRFVNGSTLVFKREVFHKVKFRDMSLAEDVYFCNDCIRNGIKIYSTNKYHHIYFRHPIKGNHTWKISDSEFMKKHCKVIGRVKDFISYVNNEIMPANTSHNYIHKDYVNNLLGNSNSIKKKYKNSLYTRYF